MSWLPVLWSRLRGMFDNGARLDEELLEHLEMLSAEYESRGMTPEEARAAACRELGNATLLREAHREQNRFPLFDSVLQDVRYGLRQLRGNPGFTVAAILMLALGIGANTAIFQLLDVIVLRPLPVHEPEKLVIAQGFWDDQEQGFSYPLLQEMNARQTVVEGLFASAGLRAKELRIGARVLTSPVVARFATGNYFRLLGTEPQAGRLFSDTDDDPSSPPVAVIGHRFWQSEFGGAQNALGQPILVNGLPHTIVGITRAEFFGEMLGTPVDVWFPTGRMAQISPGREGRSSIGFTPMARLRSDVPVATAEAALSVLWSQLREYSIQARGVQRYHLEFRSGEQGLGGLQNQFSKPLWLLMAIAGVVALIVCSNLASLLLARASSRVHEMGVRLALGAGRGRLLRQLLTESLILAGLGGILGLALAWVAARALVEMASMGETWHLAMEMNWRVVGFTALASVTSALVFGLAPALIGTRLGLRTALETSQRSHSGGRSRATAVRFFLAGQIALSMLLVAGSFLLVRSFWNVAHQDFGYQPEGVLMARLTVDDGNVRQLFAVETHEAVYRRLRSIPGVQFSGLTGAGLLDTGIGIGGSDLATPERNVPQSAGTRWLAVSPGYTEAMQIPILKGRALNDADRRGSARVTVISETVARLLFGKSDPIGQRFSMGKIYEPQKALEVVGVMRDVRFATPREPLGPLMFLPLGQAPLATSPTVILRTAGDPTAFVEPLRKAVREAAPGLKIDKVDTLRATIQVHARRERLLAWLSGAFGGLALVLAAMGLYGVIAYTAELRTKEMGIRLALGADRSHVRWLLLRSILSLLGLGVVVGTGVAIGMGRFMESLLFELAPNDPATLVAAAGVLCAVGMLAGYLPARRAVKLDPMMALRED